MSNYIFDFDGTIADTLDHVIAVFNMVSRRTEPLSPEEIDQLRRMSSRQAIKASKIPMWRVPGMIKKGMQSFQARIPKMHTFEGLPEVLKKLSERGDSLYIITSNTEPNVEEFLRIHHMRPYFEAVCCEAKLFGKAKHIRKLMKVCEMAPDETYYIGDETRDIAAAHKAGIRSIAVGWGFNHESVLGDNGADYVISRPEELLGIPS